MGRWRKIGAAEEREIWNRIEAGENLSSVGRALGRHSSAIHMLLKRTGGARPRSAPPRSKRFLTLEEREEISRGVSANESLRCIARRLGRAPSTISREVERNEGRTNYRATDAEKATRQRERRPKAAKLVLCPRLARVVEAKLAIRWSPQQIAAWLPVEYPNDPEMRVSHETIYMSLFVQGRGALRKELTTCLRSGRAIRRPRAARQKPLAGLIQEMVMISERPAEVADRAVPGHWEGDLLMGKKKLIDRHLGRAQEPIRHVGPGPGRHQGRDRSQSRRQPDPQAFYRAAAVPHVGSGQGDERAPSLHRRHRSPGLLLRTVEPLAARIERKHEWTTSSVLPQGQRPPVSTHRPTSTRSLANSMAGLDRPSDG